MEEEKQKSLEVVKNAQKSMEDFQRKLQKSQKEANALVQHLKLFTGSFNVASDSLENLQLTLLI